MAEVDPREWHPSHTLSRISVQVLIHEDGVLSATVLGYAESHRTSLWSYEVESEEASAIEITDHIAHVIQVAVQDMPDTQPRLDFGVTGGLQGWTDQPLF